jgi:hypothetical protein
MTEQNRIQLENYLNEILRPKFNDIVVHLDVREETSTLVCFWNKLNAVFYDNCHTFKFSTNNFNTTLENEIKPYFDI